MKKEEERESTTKKLNHLALTLLPPPPPTKKNNPDQKNTMRPWPPTAPTPHVHTREAARRWVHERKGTRGTKERCFFFPRHRAPLEQTNKKRVPPPSPLCLHVPPHQHAAALCTPPPLPTPILRVGWLCGGV